MAHGKDERLEKARDAAHMAAERLHHLSMRYVGSLMEIAQGGIVPIGLIPQGTHGLSECRDLIDLVMLTRAEINAITRLLVASGTFTETELTRQFADEYEWFAKMKAKQFNLEISDDGLIFNKSSK